MHTLYIQEKNKNIQLADHWDELSSGQLEYVFQRALKVVDGQIPYEQYCVEVFKYLTGLKIGAGYVAKEKLNLNHRLNEAIYILATDLCGWGLDKVDHGYVMNYNSFMNPFKTITSGNKKLHGPADLLSDITFKEFRSAKDHMDYYGKALREADYDQADIFFHRFIACLYRTGNRKRKPLVIDDLEIIAADVIEIPVWQKRWIMNWFSFCVNYIQTEPFEIEGAEVELEMIFPQPDDDSEPAEKGLGWSGLLIDITKSGVFGTLEQCDSYPLFQILLFWYKTHLENLKEKAKNI